MEICDLGPDLAHLGLVLSTQALPFPAQRQCVRSLLLRSQLPAVRMVDFAVQLTIHSYRSRLCDFANLVGGAKAIPDCLIQLGWLRDDAPQWLTATYEQTVVAAAQARTEISWQPLG